MEIKGKYNTAIVYTDNVEETAVMQITDLCNQEFTSNSKIRIMPDVHAGAGCVIGTTMTITDKVVPNLVGVDIGCGMRVSKLFCKDIDLERLDDVIRRVIPAGFNIREKPHFLMNEVDFDGLRCLNEINRQRAELSIGTLGGGNHFIEAGKDEEGSIYLVVHTGSRNLGKQVADFYQRKGYERLKAINNNAEIIEKCRAEGRDKDIQGELHKVQKVKFQKDLAWVEGNDLVDYLHDINIVQKFSVLNRWAIVCEILSNMGEVSQYTFETIHNYIDIDTKVLRKGAVSAQNGERIIIPMNMRDGSLICIGKGNQEWNCSAPHGAGRLMSRKEAKQKVSMNEFAESMIGIFTTSVNESTIDESPMAYKPMQEIIDNLRGTATIERIIKPIYNFKAAE